MKRLESVITVPLILIFCFALLIRVTYNFTAAAGYFPLHDSLTYQNIASNIIHEHCYCLYSHLPTVDRAPLWPFVIAVVNRLLGPQNILVRLVLCLIGSGTCALLYLFGKDLFGERIGIFAGLVGAIYPFLYVYDGMLYSESLYIFLLFAFCYTLYRLQRSPHLSLMITSGVLLGLLSLTRPNGIALLGLVIVWAFVMYKTKMLTWNVAIRSTLVIVVLSFLFIVPWTIRNYRVTHSLVTVAVGDGKVLLGAYNYETADPVYQHGYYAGVWIIPSESTPWIADRYPTNCAGNCEVTRDKAYEVAALQWIQQHITYMPFMLGLHFVNTWQVTAQEADFATNRFPDRFSSQLVVVMMETITPLVFALAFFGAVVTSERWRELLFLYLIVALTLIQNIALYGIPRFRAPIEPILILLAAGAVWWIASHSGKWRKRKMVEAEDLEDATDLAESVQSVDLA